MAENLAAETKSSGHHVPRGYIVVTEGLRKGGDQPSTISVKGHKKIHKISKHGKGKMGKNPGRESSSSADTSSPASSATTVPVRGKKLTDPSDIIGVSSITGRSITLAEGVAAAKTRVAADKLIPDAKTPDAIVKLSQIKLA
ncbi:MULTISPECIES: hypothetical protein [Rhodococcus]|uniref:Phage protein n=1 Tax=Rhodococcus qingshengii JCM 15477 TaxID=1303681 RepID=A0AB38RM92_RHOSG|nr:MULTISPECIES: hypothetical protein [Rhodococcus]MYV31251.1 hypothetical protein [Rhodococcus erythropolis]UPU46361.1 hypothetical protein M0639_30825 [Rhodococcus qingshengii JCM 15477]